MTVWQPIDDGYADLTSHDTFVAGVPHNTFARLRREDPVHWTEWDGGRGFWSITRHADIKAMNRQHARYSSARGIRMEDQTYEEYLARRTFQETDPPEHAQTRLRVHRAFTKGAVAAFEDEIRALCVDILDQALEQASFDATKAIARELPMRMLGRIIGVPDADLPWLVEKGDALIANTDPDFTTHVLDKMDTDEFRMMPFNSPAGAELYAYARELMRAPNPDRGVIATILAPDAKGETMSEQEFRNFFCLLVAAGNDTTRYSIAAGIQALCYQGELLAQMRESAIDWKLAADEIVRWATPALYFRRTVTEDHELHGKRLRAGDKLLYWFASANRDETVFDEPFRVDLARNPNPHLSFGQYGPHVCLGMWLAKLEVQVLFQELSRRVATIEPAGEQQFLRSNFVGGLKRLPVQITRT
ncbi:MAG: cytochrome P450 [Pseudomonadota bacterium]